MFSFYDDEKDYIYFMKSRIKNPCVKSQNFRK